MSVEHLTRRQLAKAYRFASSDQAPLDSAWYRALNTEAWFRRVASLNRKRMRKARSGKVIYRPIRKRPTRLQRLGVMPEKVAEGRKESFVNR